MLCVKLDFETWRACAAHLEFSLHLLLVVPDHRTYYLCRFLGCMHSPHNFGLNASGSKPLQVLHTVHLAPTEPAATALAASFSACFFLWSNSSCSSCC